MTIASTHRLDGVVRDERTADLFVSGLRLRYWVGGKGPPLVVLHGAGGNLQLVLSSLCGFRALADEHTLIAYDQRGCGDSERLPLLRGVPSPHSLHIDRFVEDLAFFVDQLGLQRFSLCGLSFSGAIALRYAQRFPNRVDRLVCISGGPIPMPYEIAAARIRDVEHYQRRTAQLSANFRDWSEFTIDSFYQFELGSQLCAALANPIHYDDFLQLGSAGRWKDVPHGAFGFWMQRRVSDYAKGFDAGATTEALRSIEVPTLVTWGRCDPFPFENMSYLRDTMPQCELVVFEQSGHFPQLEQSELFTTTIRSFLSERVYSKL